jgi:hypothetical protein
VMNRWRSFRFLPARFRGRLACRARKFDWQLRRRSPYPSQTLRASHSPMVSYDLPPFCSDAEGNLSPVSELPPGCSCNTETGQT